MPRRWATWAPILVQALVITTRSGAQDLDTTPPDETTLTLEATPPTEDVELLLAAARDAAARGDRDLAEERWRRAAESAPDDPRPRVEHGRWLLEQGDSQRAVETLSEATTIIARTGASMDDAVVFGQLARAHLAVGDHESARTAASAALELDPLDTGAREVLDRVGASGRAADRTEEAAGATSSGPVDACLREDAAACVEVARRADQLGHRHDARRAAARACQLGNDTGCGIADRLRRSHDEWVVQMHAELERDKGGVAAFPLSQFIGAAAQVHVGGANFYGGGAAIHLGAVEADVMLGAAEGETDSGMQFRGALRWNVLSWPRRDRNAASWLNPSVGPALLIAPTANTSTVMALSVAQTMFLSCALFLRLEAMFPLGDSELTGTQLGVSLGLGGRFLGSLPRDRCHMEPTYRSTEDPERRRRIAAAAERSAWARMRRELQ